MKKGEKDECGDHKGKKRVVQGFMILPMKEGMSTQDRKGLKFENKVPNEIVPDNDAVLYEGSTHQDFIDMVKENYPNEGRYFVVDFITNKETGHRKLVFCAW